MSYTDTYDDPTANLMASQGSGPPDDGGNGGDSIYHDNYDAPSSDAGAPPDDPTANLGGSDDNRQKIYHDQYDVTPEATAAAQQVDQAPAYHSDPTASLGGAPSAPESADPTANLSAPEVPRQNDTRSFWDRAKDVGRNAFDEVKGLAEIPTLPARAVYDQVKGGEGFDPTQALSDTFGKAGGAIGNIVQDATGVGSRIQGSAAIALNDAKRGNWDQLPSDLNPATNALYSITGDQQPWMSDADYNARNVVSRNPAAAILPGSGGSGEGPQVIPDGVPVIGGDSLYDIPIVGGVSRAGKAIFDAATDQRGQGPSLDVGALQDDLANGMAPQAAMEKYKGSIGASIVSDLINPANFVEVPGLSEAVSSILTSATQRGLGRVAEVAVAEGKWTPEIAQQVTDVLGNRGKITQGGILDQAGAGGAQTATELRTRFTPGLTNVSTAPDAAISLLDGAAAVTRGDIAMATQRAAAHARNIGGDTEGVLNLMETVANGERAIARTAVTPEEVARLIEAKANGIRDLGGNLADPELRQAAASIPGMPNDLARASAEQVQQAAAIASQDIIKASYRAADYIATGTKLPGTENDLVHAFQGIANVTRGLMLMASAPVLAPQKFVDELSRAATRSVLAFRASDTATAQAIARLRGGAGATAFREGSTAGNLLANDLIPPKSVLNDVNPATFRSAGTGQTRFGGPLSIGRSGQPASAFRQATDRFQALFSPIDKWNQSLIAAPTQHVVRNALYQDTKNIGALRQQFAAEAANAVLQAGAPRATADAVYQRLIGARSNSEFLRAANEIAGMPGFEGGAAQARRIVEAAPPTVPDASMARGAPAREQGIASTMGGRAPLPPFESAAPSQRVAGAMNATGGAQGLVKEVTTPAKPFEYTRKNPDLPINPETGKAPLPKEIAPEKYDFAEKPTPPNRREQANATMERIKAAGGDIGAVTKEEYQQARQFLAPAKDMGDVSKGGTFGPRGSRSSTVRDIAGLEYDDAVRAKGIGGIGSPQGSIAAGGDGGAGYLSRQQRGIRDDLNAMGGFGTGRTMDWRASGAPEPRGGRWRSDQAKEIADKIDSGEMTVERARQIVARAEGHTPSPESFEYLKDLGQAARLSRSLDPAWEGIYQDLHGIRGRAYPGDVKPAAAPEPVAEAPTPFTRRSINEPAIAPGVYEPAPRPRFNASDRHDFVLPESALAPGINEKTWYHGTGHDFLDASNLASDATNPGGLFGPGMYLTDNPRIAGEYAATRARQGAKETLWNTGKGVPETPTVYETRVNAQRTLDVEKPAPADVRAIFGQHYPGRIDVSNPAATTQDLYRQLKRVAGSDEWTNDYIELNKELRRAGYDGLTHTGGLQTGGEQHRVFIGLEPQDGRQVIRDMRPYQEPNPFTRAPEPSIGVDRGMRDVVGRPPEVSATPFDPTAGLGRPPEAARPPIADPTAGLGRANVTPLTQPSGVTLPTGDLAAAQAGIRRAGAGFGDAGQAAINAGLERGYRIVGNNADQTTAGSWMKNGIGGVTPPILPFAPFHIHSAQFWASYFAAHPAMAMGMAQVLANLDDYGTLHLPGGTTVAGLIKLTTGLHVLEWAQKAYDYHQDVKAAGGNNFAQRTLKDLNFNLAGNNAFVRPFPYVSDPIASFTESHTKPLLSGKLDYETKQPLVDKREQLREYGTMAGTTGVGETLNDLTGGNVSRGLIQGLTNPGQWLGEQMPKLTDRIPGFSVDRAPYKPEMAEAHALGKVAESMGLSKYQAEKAYYDPKTPAEIALGKQLHDAVHMSVDTQAIGKLAPVQVNGAPGPLEAKGIFPPTKASSVELDKPISGAFTVKDFLSQPGNLFDLDKQFSIAKAANDTQKIRDIGRAIAAVKASDLAAHPEVAAYLDQQKADSLAKYGDTSFRGSLKPNEQSAYDAWNDLRASADYKRYVELSAQETKAYADSKGEGGAWYKANVTELNRLKDIIAGAETSIVQRYGVNPKELSNRSAVAAGYSPTYSDVTIKGATPNASSSNTTGSGGSNASSGKPKGSGPTGTYGSSGAGRSTNSTSATGSYAAAQKAGNDFFAFEKGITDKAERAVMVRALSDAGVNVFGEKGVSASRYEKALAVAQAAVDQHRSAPAAGGNTATPRGIPGFSGYRMTDAEMQAALRGQWNPDPLRQWTPSSLPMPGGKASNAPQQAAQRTGPSLPTPGAGTFIGRDGKIHQSKYGKAA